ncbi:C40 family peptidase [Lactobacillus sp. YT155]|uniref:C40 family peptidase n=1 Tax=Lactobacillus sp. YT155 TaxID=3060955 RepID=UPI00265F5A6F|nr:C40 family peptidase [Lactobacillus sp. YT155]MDO1605788.1 C40 family peptidase [Lactobacillus sp. YT155]
MKKNILKKSIIGVSGLALLSVAANEVSAATQGTVSYKEGATTVWNSTDKGQKVKSYLAQNQKVNITAEKQVFGEKWYNLGNDSWVAAKYVSTNSAAAPAASTAATSQTVTGKYANGAITIWTDANSGVATGKYMFNGQSKAVKSTKSVNGSTWYQVDGGWVSAEFVSTNGTSAQAATQTQTQQPAAQQPAAQTQTQQPAAQRPAAQAPAQSNNNASQGASNGSSVPGRRSAAQAISIARAQIGKPYVWGAKGPNAFDCSGLVYYAYGSSVGGYTVAQESAGRSVSLNALQPGDLLFWGSRGASYHVAIYIGGGQYIHAPQPGQNVKVGSMQYYMPQFAVRP